MSVPLEAYSPRTLSALQLGFRTPPQFASWQAMISPLCYSAPYGLRRTGHTAPGFLSPTRPAALLAPLGLLSQAVKLGTLNAVLLRLTCAHLITLTDKLQELFSVLLTICRTAQI